MRKENGYIKGILFVCMIIMYSQITGYVKAGEGEYVDPTVALIVSPESTFKYEDEVTVEVQVNNADSYTKYGEDTFKATKRSYIIKGGATGVTWHYTYDSGYEATQGPEDFDQVTTINREPIEIKFSIDWAGDIDQNGDVAVCFYIVEKSVDPELLYEIEWSGAGEGWIDVDPGEIVTSKACLVISVPDYSGGRCDSATFNHDKEVEADNDNNDSDQQDSDDIEDAATQPVDDSGSK